MQMLIVLMLGAALTWLAVHRFDEDQVDEVWADFHATRAQEGTALESSEA